MSASFGKDERAADVDGAKCFVVSKSRGIVAEACCCDEVSAVIARRIVDIGVLHSVDEFFCIKECVIHVASNLPPVASCSDAVRTNGMM